VSGTSDFEGLPEASALRVVGPLPEKIPQQAIDELQQKIAQNRASNLEGTVAASIPTGTSVSPGAASPGSASFPGSAWERTTQETQHATPTTRGIQTIELIPLAEAEMVIGTAPKPEAAGSTAMGQNIPQQAIDELRRRVAQKRQELAQRSSGTQVAVAPSSIPPEVPRQSETVPRKIPQQAIDELRRRVAQKRAELEASKDSEDQAATSQTVASPPSTTQGATVESSPETVAAKPMVSAPETTPTASVAKIPPRAIAQLRKLQQQFAYNPAGTTKAEAQASIQTWLDESQKAAENPELLWEPKRLTVSYPDAACRHGLDKNATDATVGVLVDPESKISSQPETIKSTGYALLNDIALEAARSYDFAASGEYKAYLLEIKFSHSDSCAGTAASGQ